MADNFDQVILKIGYHRYVVPKKAAMAFFDIVTGSDMYEFDTKWEQVGGKGMDVPYVTCVSEGSMPSIHALSPVRFFAGIENQKAKEAKEVSDGQ